MIGERGSGLMVALAGDGGLAGDESPSATERPASGVFPDGLKWLRSNRPRRCFTGHSSGTLR
jgi:hypothetical protein